MGGGQKVQGLLLELGISASTALEVMRNPLLRGVSAAHHTRASVTLGSLSPSEGKSGQQSCPMVCRALPAILHLLILLGKREGEKIMAPGDKAHVEGEVNFRD